MAKKILQIAIPAAIILGLVVTIIVMALSGPKEAPYTEGDEIGVYYYDAEDGELLLTLSGGNKFTLAGPRTNKTGTYTVEGTTITLDFLKDDDGTATVKNEGGKLVMTYNNATIPFLSKVTHTVSFGNTTLADVKVINGKPVAKPADPVKENHVFLGWYADETFTTPFDFETSTVKENTTVWAKWAEGQIDFTLNFDLGYEGATLPEINTISGKAYGVEAPERDGYIFGGWYVSMYEDGNKLTYAYNENTVFTQNTTLYAVWYEEGATRLQAPAVSVTDKAITWTLVEGANAYKLTVIAPDGTVVVDGETVTATTKAFDFSSKAEGEYKISVVAVANNEENNSDAAERYYANKALDRVTFMPVQNGMLIFSPVENAQKYLITIDCGNDAHNHTALDNGNSTVYYLGNCQMQQGGILVTVTATANGYASSVATFVYDLTLDNLGDLTYNDADDRVVWAPVAGATNYKVTVTVGDNTYTFDNGVATYFSLAGFSGEITVTVVPEANGYNSSDAVSVEVAKTAPASPDGLKATGSTIYWNAVEGATEYEVNIDGQTVIVTTNYLNIAGAGLNLIQGQNYTVTVKAFNEQNESSAPSAGLKIGYNCFDTNLTYNKNTVSWTPVFGQDPDAYYEVKVNDGLVKEYEDVTSAKVVLTQAGENLIEVRYVSDGFVSEWASITVYAYTVEFDSRSTLTGTYAKNYYAVGDVITLPATAPTYTGYVFSGWFTAPEGNGKEFTNATVYDGASYTVLYASWTSVEYDVTLHTQGMDITNIANGEIFKAPFNKNFTLPVPIPTDNVVYIFMGWYTGAYGAGIQLTDEEGNSVAPYPFTENITAYPYFTSESLAFELQADGTYLVKKGSEINDVTTLKIPATFNGVAVTVIQDAGFQNCPNLQKVSIPDTIKLVGVNAFGGCTALTNIDIYVAKPGETYETFYSSVDGVLLRKWSATKTYVEMVPRGKTGTFTIPEGATNILAKAFLYSNLSEVVIPASMVDIPKQAFYYCKSLETVTFTGGRSAALNLSAEAFTQCDAITTITLPKEFDLEDPEELFDQFPKLKAILVEEGGEDYAHIGGILTNDSKTQIIYAPKAFSGDYEIPLGVKTIASGAFNGRTGLTSITIPSYVTSIGTNAFYGCYNVRTITFQGGRTDNLSIGQNAFANHRMLNTVTFEGNETETLETGVITIGKLAFAGNNAETYRSLTTVTFGAGVNLAGIGDGAFQNNSKLENLTFGKNVNVATIGTSAFAGCSKLATVEIPASVTAIKENAFANCIALSDIQFVTEGATTIDIADYAFYGCTKLLSITLPDHLGTFRSSAFDGCEFLKEIKVNPTNEHYTNDANGILYKKEMNGETVVYTELLFYPKGLVKELGGVINNLPDTLTTIGGAAFSNNTHLVSVTVPKSVTLIDDSAFANCDNLTTLVFSLDGTTLVVGKYAFQNCTELGDKFALPAYTTSIGDYAFVGCRLVNFTVPAKVNAIGSYAFYGCTRLANVTFNCDGPLTIGAYAFAGCEDLTKANLPAGTTEIGAYAFYACSSLNDLTFGNATLTDGKYTVESSLTTIGAYAFAECGTLTKVILPNSLTKIDSYAFAMTSGNPSSLSEIIFEEKGTANLTIEFYAFANLNNVTRLVLPARVSLPVYKAQGTNTTTTYNTVTADWAISFSATSSNYATKVPYLVKDVFAGMTSLAEITIVNDTPGVTSAFASVDGVLYNADKTVLIYCPAANVGTYKDGAPTYELQIPTSVKLVASYAINNCTALKKVTFLDFDTTSENYGAQLLTIGNITNSGTYYAEPYAAIGGNLSSIVEINLPSHLGTVNMSAFSSQAKGGIDINISPAAKNLTLAKRAFDNSRAKNININVLTWTTHTFANNPYIETFTYSLAENSQINSIPDNFFYFSNGSNSVLTDFVILPEITTIGASAFSGFRALKNVNIHDDIIKIGNYAFSGTKITSVVIPKGITSTSNLGAGAFQNCTELKSITWQEGSALTTVPNYLCDGCTSLETVNISSIAAKVTSIGTGAFRDCAKLTAFDFSAFVTLKTLSSNAFTKTGLVNVDLSKTIITSLTTAFATSTAIETLILPTTVTSITNTALTNVPNLKTLTCLGAIPAAQFANVRNTQQLKVVIPANHSSLVQDEFGIIYDIAKQNLYLAPAGADLTGYVMPTTVKTIGGYAFSGAILGENFAITEGVTSIGTYAFHYTKANTISIPSTVTQIGTYAFNRSTVKYVTFVDDATSKLTNIGNYAFQYSGLVEIDIPDSVTTFGTNMFLASADLRKVTFGAKMTTTGTNPFGQCYNLEEVIFQEGLKTIDYLFQLVSTPSTSAYKSNKVTEVTIPSTVTAIGSTSGSSFAAFGNLHTVNFAEGSKLTTINKLAFVGCTSLENIEIPASVTTISNYAFYNCTALTKMDLSKTKVTSIAQEAFYNTTSLVDVTLPANLTSIATKAFANSAIKELNAPDSLATIQASAFENSGLESITFTENSKLTTITGVGAFKNTKSLNTFVMPNTLKTIASHAFEGSALTTVTLTQPEYKSELVTINDYAFYDCQNLTSFDYLNAAKTVGNYAFYNCKNMTTATLSNNLTTIGDLAFAFCTALPEAKLPASIQNVGGNPFAGISVDKIALEEGCDLFVLEKSADGTLTLYDIDKYVIYGVYGASGEYVIDNGIRDLAAGAFAGNAITSITIPYRFGEIKDATFMNCTELANVTIEYGISGIGAYAFYNTALTTPVIPETVTSFGDYAFANARNLNNVVLPKNVTTLGNGVFSGCTALTDVTFENTESFIELGTHTFYGCSSLTKVILPVKFKAAVAQWTAMGMAASAAKVEYALPAYTFAGTGIVNAVLPRVDYVYGEKVFADSKELKTITFTTTYKLQSGNAAPFDMIGWFDGCDKFEYTAIYLTLTEDMSGMSKLVSNTGIKTIHVATLNVDPEDYTTTLTCDDTNLAALGADVTIIFDDADYNEIVEYLKYYQKAWTATILDKDGNRVICAAGTGIVGTVENAQGEVIFTNPVTAPLSDPRDD